MYVQSDVTAKLQVTWRVSVFDSCRSKKVPWPIRMEGRYHLHSLLASVVPGCETWYTAGHQTWNIQERIIRWHPVIKWYLYLCMKAKIELLLELHTGYLFFNFLEKLLLVLNPDHEFFVSFLWNRTWKQSHHKSSSIIIYLSAKHKLTSNFFIFSYLKLDSPIHFISFLSFAITRSAISTIKASYTLLLVFFSSNYKEKFIFFTSAFFWEKVHRQIKFVQLNIWSNLLAIKLQL